MPPSPIRKHIYVGVGFLVANNTPHGLFDLKTREVLRALLVVKFLLVLQVLRQLLLS